MKVFISYARADKPQVAKLVKELEGAGINVWWDKHLVPGDEFRAEIERQLDLADHVIVIWTRKSVRSQFVRDEASRALKKDKLIPIRLDESDIPIGFGELHVADCSQSVNPLLKALDTPTTTAITAIEQKQRIKITKLERLILANQYEILSILKPSLSEHYRKTLECLHHGYIDRLRIDEWIDDDLDPTIHKDVIDILEMHRALRFSYIELTDNEQVDESKILFLGFDGNYETSYLSYTHHLLEVEGLYQELHNSGYYNSHSPMLPRYIAMLRKWYELERPMQLGIDEIKAISMVEADPDNYNYYLK